MTDNISEKDKKDWQTFLSGNEKLPNKDIKFKKKQSLKTRSIDLHGNTLDYANKLVYDFIINCYENNINKIIVVTGKGLHSQNENNPYVSKDLSILKYSIPEFIENNVGLMKMITEIKDAKVEDGGSGAFYIYLRKKKMIIWLASYPKSGNTMLRTMLSPYLFTKDGSFNFDIMKNIKQFPNWAVFEKLGVNYKDHNEVIKNSIRVQESFNKKETVGFVKTHNMLFNFNRKYPFTNLENTLGVIYIVRDPRNVALSYARHLKLSLEETVKFMTKGKANDMFLMGNWAENFISWKPFLNYNKYLLIKYEDLVSKREETFIKILQFIFRLRNINFTLDAKKMETVLKNTTFENLKNLEKEKGFRESIKGDDGKQIPFFDKGKSRDWSKNLDKNLTEEIERCFKNEMMELGYL